MEAEGTSPSPSPIVDGDEVEWDGQEVEIATRLDQSKQEFSRKYDMEIDVDLPFPEIEDQGLSRERYSIPRITSIVDIPDLCRKYQRARDAWWNSKERKQTTAERIKAAVRKEAEACGIDPRFVEQQLKKVDPNNLLDISCLIDVDSIARSVSQVEVDMEVKPNEDEGNKIPRGSPSPSSASAIVANRVSSQGQLPNGNGESFVGGSHHQRHNKKVTADKLIRLNKVPPKLPNGTVMTECKLSNQSKTLETKMSDDSTKRVIRQEPQRGNEVREAKSDS